MAVPVPPADFTVTWLPLMALEAERQGTAMRASGSGIAAWWWARPVRLLGGREGLRKYLKKRLNDHVFMVIKRAPFFTTKSSVTKGTGTLRPWLGHTLPTHVTGCLQLARVQVVAWGAWRLKPDKETRSMTSMSMRQMLEAGVHFGHQTRFWKPEDGPLHLRRA